MIYGDVLLMAGSKSQAQESWSSALESLAEVPAFEPESDAAERQSRTEELRLRLKLFSEPQAAVVPIIESNASLTDEGCDVWTRNADRGMEDGLVCIHLGRPDLAVRFIRPLANHRELYPDPPDRGSACYLLGLAYARLDTPDEALDYLAECLKASPHHLDANVLQSELYLALGQADKAESAARRALGINSKSATAWSALATVLDRHGKDEGALTALHEATQLEAASYDTWAAKARQAEASGQIDTAIGAWERVNELRPGCAATQCHIGVLLHRQGTYERATRALEAALLLQLSVGDRVLCLKLLASMCGSYARHRNALRALKDAAKLKPDDCELLLLTSKTYRALQQPLHAIRLLEDAMRRTVESDELLRELAELYLEGGKGRRCCNLLENASPRVSLSAATLSILGDARLALKEWDAAASTFSAALKLDAQFPGAHYGLASAFWAKDDPDGARTHWNILKTLDGSAAFRLGERLPGLYGKS
jgi:tetratricopeptide (TPR) repeat protein